MKKLVKVKFAVQAANLDTPFEEVEFFNAVFPETELPQKGDFIARKLPNGEVIMYIIERKVFGIQRGKMHVSYYSVSAH